ncbi:MAG: hypothetical protein ACRDTD_23920 [Pseudonocardiaceae bacterium]
MVAALIPVGQYAGQFFTSKQQIDPAYHEVRLGGEFLRLTSIEHATWAVTHSDPELLAEGTEPNRAAVEAGMRELGYPDIGEPLKTLQDLGLIASVLPVGAGVKRFAEMHRVVPQVLGLGNTADALDDCLLGTPGEPRLALPFDVYQVWLASELHPCLWDACEQVAAAFVAAAEQTGKTRDGSPITAIRLAQATARALPLLIATSCAYLDLRR